MNYYNIGAGNFEQPGWTNVDYESEHYRRYQPAGFIPHDLTTLADLPIETASADIVYCSHVIEHVPDAAVAKLLSEAYRILKPGGGLRLVTPCIELAYRNWVRENRLFFEPQIISTGHADAPMDASCTQLWLHHFASQLTEIDADTTAVRKFTDQEVLDVFNSRDTVEEALDYFTSLAVFNPDRPENHCNWFSDHKLRVMLSEAGFQEFYRSGPMQSCYAAMRVPRAFDPHFTISIYFEACR